MRIYHKQVPQKKPTLFSILFNAFLLIGLFAGSFTASADTDEDALNAGIEALKEGIQNVSTDKTTYNQDLTILGPAAYILNYKVDEISSKGKSKQTVYTFNLADLDENLISRQSSGSQMYVSLRSKNQQKLFKYSEDGEQKGYANEFRIYVNDVDNARIIIDKLKETVPLANKLMKNRLQLSSYEQMQEWLKNNIGTVILGSDTYNQELVFNPDVVGKVSMKLVHSTGKKVESFLYEFNLADLSTHLLKFDVSGNKLEINVQVERSLKLIKTFEDGQLKNYRNDIEIYAESIDQARDITNVFKMAIEKAGPLVEAALPVLPDQASLIIEAINADVKAVDLNTEQISQSFTKDCVTEFRFQKVTSKSSTEESYSFNFNDLNANLVAYKVKGNELLIELFTESAQKLIKVTADGQIKEYSKQMSIYVNDPEAARLTVYRLKALIELCKNTYQSPVPEGTMTEKISWLSERIPDVTKGDATYTQKLEIKDGDDIRFELTTSGKKSSTYEVFEFNLCDIDPNMVEFSIKGKDLFVKLTTKFKQKIIKSYKDGKTQKFTDEVLIRENDIESARIVIETIKAAIAQCE